MGDFPGVVDDPRDQPHRPGLGGVDDPAREGEIRRVARSDDRGQANGPAPGAEQAVFDARFGERRVPGGDPQVTGECEFDAAAPRGPVDARDDHPVAGRDGSCRPLAAFDERLGGLAVGQRRDGVQVGTGTERRPGAPEIDHGRLGTRDCVGQFVEASGGERVASVGPVERDDADVAVGLDGDHTDHDPDGGRSGGAPESGLRSGGRRTRVFRGQSGGRGCCVARWSMEAGGWVVSKGLCPSLR